MQHQMIGINYAGVVYENKVETMDKSAQQRGKLQQLPKIQKQNVSCTNRVARPQIEKYW